MPLQGILNTARTLSYWTRRQDVTANNLANAGADGFKGDRLVARALDGMHSPVPARDLDLDQGSFRETGRPLDVALDGDGFLVVGTPQGERLTRGGSLRLDAAGRLTDSHGDPVLGLNGPLVLRGGQVEIRGDGTVLVDGATAGELRRVLVEDKSTLLKEGFGRFRTSGRVRPAVDEGPMVRQGAVEESNVDPVTTMVDLVTIQRAYGANVDALRAMDSVLAAVANEVGKV